MELQYGYELHTLDTLSTGLNQSPEEFISDIEDQLESGEITEDEAILIIKDFCKRGG